MLLLLSAKAFGSVEPLNAAQVSYLPCRTEKELSREFENMRRQGFDTVVLRVFQNRRDRIYPFVVPLADSGVYFATKQAPVVADILTPLIPLARAAGLKVFAWANTLSTDLGDETDLYGRRFDLNDNEVVSIDKLDPFHPEVRRRLTILFQDLARYDLDGILFQDDLVLRHTEGFSAAGLAAYLKYAGRLPNPDDFYQDLAVTGKGKVRVGSYSPDFHEWARWKCLSLMELGTALRDAVRQVNPRIKVAINLPYEILSNPAGALAWFSLDFSMAQKTGFDYLALMLYHRQMSKELKLPEEEALTLVENLVAAGTKNLMDSRQLLVKVQAVDFDDLQPIGSVERARLNELLNRRAVSCAWFPYFSP